jgi:hypothetical protein
MLIRTVVVHYAHVMVDSLLVLPGSQLSRQVPGTMYVRAIGYQGAAGCFRPANIVEELELLNISRR